MVTLPLPAARDGPGPRAARRPSRQRVPDKISSNPFFDGPRRRHSATVTRGPGAERRRTDLSDQDWLDFAQRTYRENAQGVPVPDMDPRISDAFRNPPTAPADMWPIYAQIKRVPMLVIRGALSDLLSTATVERMARERPDVQSVTVPNRGHTPLLDEPECIAAIDGFLTRHGQS